MDAGRAALGPRESALHAVVSRLIASEACTYLAIGGSRLSGDATATSDYDLFMLTGPHTGAALQGGGWVDVEAHSLEWFASETARLRAFRPSISQAPPFSFYDLRFLARLHAGAVLCDRRQLEPSVRELGEPLRIAVACVAARTFLNVYQDAVGLLIGERFDEALVLCGELLQRACQVALLQTSLVDPAAKFAFRHARASVHDPIRAHATTLHSMLSSARPERRWLEAYLRKLNALIAAGVCAAHNLEPVTVEVTGDLAEFVRQPELCLMGLPGLFAIQDTTTHEIHAHTPALAACICAAC